MKLTATNSIFWIMIPLLVLSCQYCGAEKQPQEPILVNITPAEGYFSDTIEFTSSSPKDDQGNYFVTFDVRGIKGIECTASAESYVFPVTIQFFDGDKMVAEAKAIKAYKRMDGTPFWETSTGCQWEGDGPYRVKYYGEHEGIFSLAYDPDYEGILASRGER